MADGVELDGLDRRLLNLLQDDSRRSIAELAVAAGASAPTCHRRLQRLRAAGVIERETAVVNPDHAPRRTFVFVEVALERHNPQTHMGFERKMAGEPLVSQCYHLSGQVDYLVVMSVADIEEYHRAAMALFSQDPEVRTFRSSIAIRRVKFEPAVRF